MFGGYATYEEFRAAFVRSKRKSCYQKANDGALVNETLTAMRGAAGVRACARRHPEQLRGKIEQRAASDWWAESGLWRDEIDSARPTESAAIRNVRLAAAGVITRAIVSEDKAEVA